MSSKKQTLGQFFSTNYTYILHDLHIPDDITHIIEPFAGDGDLIKFIVNKEKYIAIECYDIEPRFKDCIKRDTISNPPNYNGKFILTNPPYLARNKSSEKALFDKYDVNDLYKCFIKELIKNRCLGGIIIIPLNFWSSIRKADIELRRDFLEIYNIVHMNIFEEQVFDDTTSTVCSFQFSLKKSPLSSSSLLKMTIYPIKKYIEILLNKENQYTIGGEIYQLKTKNKYSITRLTSKNIDKMNTNILVKCIDDSEAKQIGLSIVDDIDIYIDETPNSSARTYATLIIEPEISLEMQEKLVGEFNRFLKSHREKYHSLFLANYRESKDIARKRISFDLVYRIAGYILNIIL